jgi:hypothetical protein
MQSADHHRKVQWRMPGSSLVEVLVALSLSSIVFVIGMVVWLQLNGHNAPYRHLDYRMRARTMIAQAIQSQDLGDAVWNAGGVQYVRKIRPLHAASGLYEVQVQVFGQDPSPILTRSKIVHYEAD